MRRLTRARDITGTVCTILLGGLTVAAVVWSSLTNWLLSHALVGWSVALGLAACCLALALVWESQREELASMRDRLSVAETKPNQRDRDLYDRWREAFPATKGTRFWLGESFYGERWLTERFAEVLNMATEWHRPGFADHVVDGAFQEVQRFADAFSHWLSGTSFGDDTPGREGICRIGAPHGPNGHIERRAIANEGVELAQELSDRCDRFEKVARTRIL
jgi:hypothetical protein